MSSRIPQPPSAMEAEGIHDPGFSDGQEVTGDEGDGMEPPHDIALAVDDFGTTAEEMAEGEPLDSRLAREDNEADLVSEDVGTDLGGSSAEESAMHLEPEV